MSHTKIKVAADTASGVYKVDEFDGAPTLEQQDFYESLRTLKDGEQIFAELDAEMYKRIEDEYGVH